MPKSHLKRTSWLEVGLVLFAFIIMMACQLITKSVAELVSKILRVMFLPSDVKPPLSTVSRQSPPPLPLVLSSKRLHVLKTLENVNSFDSLQEEHVQYDLLFKKNSNRKGKNVSFSDPLTPDDGNAAFTSDEEGATLQIKGDVTAFMTPGFE